MSEFAIEVENLTKVFYPQTKLKETFGDLVGNLLKKKDKNECFEVKALNNVSFKVKKGEVLGIIGDNGSGKSTLLKILSGVTDPSSGLVRVHGSVLSILEIGTGFHPELSGRDNIHFMGELYGLTKKEILLNEKAIIDFSELIDFIDVPVKNYSSGMFMRLAFSIIIHLDADVILLDEVFSVGDMSFKEKSFNKILELKKRKKTLIIVSHEVALLIKLCTRFLVFENEMVINSSDMREVAKYINDSFKVKPINYSKKITNGDEKTIIILNDYESNLISGEIKIELNAKADNFYTFSREEEISVVISFKKKRENLIIPNINLRNNFSAFMDISINPLVFNPEIANQIMDFESVSIECTIPRFCLNNGLFFISLYFVTQNSEIVLKFDDIFSINISFKVDYLNRFLYDGNFKGCLQPNFKWTLYENRIN